MICAGATTAPLTVEMVTTRRQWRTFHALSWRVYRDDPYWVPPPAGAEEKLLDAVRNPFFRHAERACWLARRGSEVVGRIAAILDHTHNQVHGESTAFFGFFEFLPDLDAAATLFNAARGWAIERGCRVLRGPFNPSINHECGLLVDGFGASPCILMSYNPQYYPEFYDRLGLSKARDLYAYWFSEDAVLPEKTARAAEWVRRQAGLTVRPLDLRRLDAEIARARAVFDRAWRNNWGFVPMTDEEWSFLAREFRPLLVPELVLIAEAQGEPVGLLLALPDVNPLLLGLRKWWWPLVYIRLALGAWRPAVMRMALLGLVPECQNLGVAAVLYQELYRNGKRLGYQGAEFSWVLEDNHLANRAAVAMGAKRYRTYRLYETAL